MKSNKKFTKQDLTDMIRKVIREERENQSGWGNRYNALKTPQLVQDAKEWFSELSINEQSEMIKKYYPGSLDFVISSSGRFSPEYFIRRNYDLNVFSVYYNYKNKNVITRN